MQILVSSNCLYFCSFALFLWMPRNLIYCSTLWIWSTVILLVGVLLHACDFDTCYGMMLCYLEYLEVWILTLRFVHHQWISIYSGSSCLLLLRVLPGVCYNFPSILVWTLALAWLLRGSFSKYCRVDFCGGALRPETHRSLRLWTLSPLSSTHQLLLLLQTSSSARRVEAAWEESVLFTCCVLCELFCLVSMPQSCSFLPSANSSGP